MTKQKKSGLGASPTITRPGKPKRKRSLEVPLLWLGAAALIGYPFVRDATAEKMVRGGYADRYSCECDYRDRCTYEDGRWVGPWYPQNAQDPRDADSGNRCRSSYRSTYYGGGRYYSGDPEYRAPTQQRGYRGGFGGTGATRSARS
ncbi:hypothetical protein [Lysobacter silvisoli]|uniref:Uncharacterized protein n=1 Tax=Lysobacter silvisoli TaxID=2293254 RepID=A0A371JWT0_9GAMM|nr:hypothetical protein [Lysobacter silvisoli]RDZ26129.1 hypothetical protein DX914_17790 [Lysobacter silvisoli]